MAASTAHRPAGKIRWTILTGHYPPQPGGVSDYTRLVAEGLARAGDEVHVWASPCEREVASENGVTVHRLPDHFGLKGLACLNAAFRSMPPFDRVLVQYVPHSFGWKAMNVPFCLWLYSQRRLPTWVMFHEVAFPIGRPQPWKHNVLGIVNRLMAALLARSAQRLFVSIPGWIPLIRTLAPRHRRMTWLPVPSTVPIDISSAQVEQVRKRIAPEPTTILVGHFGTFGPLIAVMLAEVLPPILLADDRRVGLLIGRGSEGFAADLALRHPALRHRLIATGPLLETDIGAFLAACDLLVQPYPDGASTRRTSLMAGLAMGVPIATTEGFLSEPLWRESEAVALVAADQLPKLAEAAERMLSNREARRELGERGRVYYEQNFALERTIAKLRSQQDEPITPGTFEQRT